MEMKRERIDEGVFKHFNGFVAMFFFVFEIDPAGNYHTKSKHLPGAFGSTMLQSGSRRIDPGLFEMIQFDPFDLLQKIILRNYSVGLIVCNRK